MKIIRIVDGDLTTAAKEAAEALRAGGIVVYPTDTVYGLAVNPFNSEAVKRLRSLKRREAKKPISVIVPSAAHMDAIAHVSDKARALAERHLPGPLTLVMRGKDMPEEITLNEAIGVRIPAEPFCIALSEAFGHPYTTTSANKSGHAVPETIEALMDHFRFDLEDIALFVDGGPRPSRFASTVVSCVDETPYILREGALSREELGL